MPKHTATSSVPAKKQKSIRSASLENDKYTKLARSLVLKSLAGIIQGLIDKAVKGGYQHAKLLFDLCGISRLDRKKALQQKKSLSDALLRGLEIQMDCMQVHSGSSQNTKEKEIPQDGHEKHTGI